MRTKTLIVIVAVLGAAFLIGLQNPFGNHGELVADTPANIDVEGETAYRNDSIIIFFELDAGESDIMDVVNGIPGNIVTENKEIAMYEVYIGKHSLSEIERLCGELAQSDIVYEAFPNYTHKVGLDGA